MYKGLTAFFIIGAAAWVSSFPLRAQMPSPQIPSPQIPSPQIPSPQPLSPQGSNPVPNNAAPASDVYFLNRAKNLARQAAIQANGGLSQYRPDPIMYGPAIQTSYVRNNNGSITFRFTGSAPGVPTPKFETVATVAANGVVNLDYNGSPRTAIGAASLPGSPSGTANTNGPVSIAVPAPTNSLPLSNPSSSNTSPIPLSPSDGPLPGMIAPTSIPGQGTSSSKPSTIAWVDQDAFVARARNLARQAAIKANGGLKAYRPEPSMYGPSTKSPFVKNADGSLTFSFQGGTPGAALTLMSVVIVNPDGTVKIQYNGPPVR